MNPEKKREKALSKRGSVIAVMSQWEGRIEPDLGGGARRELPIGGGLLPRARGWYIYDPNVTGVSQPHRGHDSVIWPKSD